MSCNGVREPGSPEDILSLPAFHVLHTHNDIAGVVQKRAVEIHNIWRSTFMHDLQLFDYALSNVLLGFNVDNLI